MHVHIKLNVTPLLDVVKYSAGRKIFCMTQKCHQKLLEAVKGYALGRGQEGVQNRARQGDLWSGV